VIAELFDGHIALASPTLEQEGRGPSDRLARTQWERKNSTSMGKVLRTITRPFAAFAQE
jgi:hypothetical protein